MHTSRRVAGRWVVAAAAVGLALTTAAGCRRSSGYSQATPDDVIKSAKLMVEKGDARRLSDLIYADTPEMRAILDQLGGLLASVQDLAVTIEKQFPAEVAKVKAEAEEAAKKGQATSFISRLAGRMGGPQGGGTPRMRTSRNRDGTRNFELQLDPSAPPRPAQGGDSAAAAPSGPRRGGGGDPGEMFNQMAREFFIDPYGWLARQNEKLTTTPIADDLAVVNWDGQPAFAGMITMKEVKGKWYIVLPTSLPVVSGAMPRSKEEFEIFGAVIDVFDNAVKDVADDVKKGRAESIDDVARSAGEKVFMPAALAFFAYSKAMDARKKADTKPAPEGK